MTLMLVSYFDLWFTFIPNLTNHIHDLIVYNLDAIKYIQNMRRKLLQVIHLLTTY